MASQEIEYAAGNDTGERVDTSIAPLLPGEIVKSAVANRRTECLRNRSEVIRDALIDQRYLADTDIKWFMSYGDDITGANPGADLPLILWDPVTGTFTIDTVLLLQPIKTPDTDTVDSIVYTFVTDTISIFSAFRNYAGANRREVRWVWTHMAGAAAVVSGTPTHILTISVDSGGSTQVTDVDNALNALVVSGELATAGFAYSVTGGGDFIAACPADHDCVGTFEREMHRIPSSQINAFFAVPTNALADGDTLAIYYEYSIEPGGTGGRRQSCPTNLNISITWGQLCILSATHNPEMLPLSVPICKRIGNDLIFLDGTICYGGMLPAISQLYAGEHGYTVDRIINAASTVMVDIVNMWADAVLPTGHDSTINAALNGIVGDLALFGVGADGAGKVGAEKVSGSPDSMTIETVGGQLSELLTLTNARIRSSHPTASSAVWICLWRSSNVATTNNAAVTRSTTSLYWMNGQFSLVTGAYWLTASQLKVGTGGAGSVQLSWWIGSSGCITNSVKLAPGDGDVINAMVTTAWDVIDIVSGNPALNSMNGAQKTFNCDIKYGEDQICLREAFSTADWHLVYRDGGRTTTPADVGWDTLSVYETNITGVAGGRLEIYGGYLSAATVITTAPLGAGLGTVSFKLFSNASTNIERSGICAGIAGNTPRSIVTPAHWDLLDIWKLVGGFWTMETHGVSGLYYKSWYIRNKFEEPIEINDTAYLNAILEFGGDQDPVTDEYLDYLKGTSVVAPDQFAKMFTGTGVNKPAIWYNNFGIFVTSNADYDNNGTVWSCHDPGSPAIATWWTNAGEIYQLYKAATGGNWSTLGWDSYQLVNSKGTTSWLYTRGLIASGDPAVVTTVPDTLTGHIVINMTISGERRCGLFRMDGSGIYLVSGNEAPGTTVWSVLPGTLQVCVVFKDISGYIALYNSTTGAGPLGPRNMTNITIGSYLGV